MTKDPKENPKDAEVRKESTQKALGAYKDLAKARSAAQKRLNLSDAQKKAAARREENKKKEKGS